MAQYLTYQNRQLNYITDPVTQARFRTGQLSNKFVEQEYVAGIWTSIGGCEDIVDAGCYFRQGARDGNYVVDKELYVGGFADIEDTGWENILLSSSWTP